MEDRRRRLKKEGKSYALDEDDPVKFKIAVNILTMKLFADLERKYIKKHKTELVMKCLFIF